LQTDDERKALDAGRRAVDADPFVDNAHLLLYRLFTTSYDMHAFTDATRYCASLHEHYPDVAQGWLCQLYLLTTESTSPDIALAWQIADSTVGHTVELLRRYERQKTDILVAAVLARASARQSSLADSARRLTLRALRDTITDPARELRYDAAFTYSLLGDDDAAFRQLSDFLAINPTRALSVVSDDNWWFQRLRKDPRFARLGRGR
jgi:tetratricopeptide (TPR) repeat protein